MFVSVTSFSFYLVAAESSAVGVTERKGAQLNLKDLKFTSSQGEINLETLAGGKTLVINLVYFGCPSICSTALAHEASILKEASAGGSTKYQVVAVSINPNEKPEIAAQAQSSFAKLAGLMPSDQIHFLTGTQEQIKKLTSQVGFSYVEDPKSGEFLHSSVLVFVDSQGRITQYLHGQNYKVAEFNNALNDSPRTKGFFSKLGSLFGNGSASASDDDLLCLPNYFTMAGFASVSTVLEDLKKQTTEQISQLQKIKTFHNFKLKDSLKQSGITFRHQMVEDAGPQYKAVHYDHGTGIAAADIDQDGRVDVYFTNQLGENELWRNLGGGKFENITSASGVGMKNRISVGASFADFNNDGRADLFVTTVRHGNSLFENLGNGKFKDVSKEMGLDYSGHSSGAVFFDFNNDGYLDLFLGNLGKYTTDKKGPGGYYIGQEDAFWSHLMPERNEKSLLYVNNLGKGFKEVSTEMGLNNVGFSGDAIALDINKDGWQDLYVLNMQGPNHFFLNNGGKSFTDETKKYFPKTSWGAMGAALTDYNQDGHSDLFVTDMHSDMLNLKVSREFDKRKMPVESSRILPNPQDFILGSSFFQGDRSGKYSEVSDKKGVESYWPWGPSAADFNADGFEDFFITAGMNFPFRYQPNTLLLNDAGKTFQAAEFALGIEPRAELIQDWFTVDCKKPQNQRVAPVCAACSSGSCPAMSKEGLMTVIGAKASRSSVSFDIDNDGDLDLITNEYNSGPQVLVSNLSEQKDINWLKVSLEGRSSNRSGTGATVRFKVGGRWHTQYRTGKSGYLSQSDMPLYFGLGPQQNAEAVEIEWPGGKKQKIAGPFKGRQSLKIVEDVK
ncbi:MAG: ypmQ 2 [Pseudobdellovibrio sp.]|nr:ypmQ 2 [Pseudobdellovibrio sp.]